MRTPQAIAIMGPTASGKSAVAEVIAERFGCRIVNADAFQVYRGFDIGTGKPTNRDGYDLIDLLDPHEHYTAGRFVTDAEPLIQGYLAAGSTVVVCGGTGLYVRALWEGYSAMKPPTPELREQLKQDLNNLGVAGILDREGLSEADLGYDVLSNPHRLLRFLEKRRMPNEPRSRSAWLSGHPKIAIDIGRDQLVGRIESRIRRMLDDGWRDEVRTLLESGVPTSAPAFRAIGYRQIAESLEGRMSFDEAVHLTLIATRQYAKRQMTWLRREPRLHWVDGHGNAISVADLVEHIIRGGS
ncbi:MAG: tRNA (adenosine(37)-N6)-dimethylallyltransferase MiaA [Fimbriimonadales bacterium]